MALEAIGRTQWSPRGAFAPAIRRAAWSALPVGAGLLFDLGLDVEAAGAISSGALAAGFVAFDAPARTRAVWQLLAAPAIALSAALGVISGSNAVLAVVVMTLFATAAGFCVAISPRVAIAGMMAVLALLVAQGLELGSGDAERALFLALAGGLLEALWSLIAAVSDHGSEEIDLRRGVRAARAALARNLTLESRAFRHALRWGITLGIAVGVYRSFDTQGHGYWVPLTVLFVLKPEVDDTRERLVMRAAGTIAGLTLATAFAELFGYEVVPTALVLTLAAALSFALLAIEYALFTAAITTFVVLLSDALGEHALEAADQRGLATAIGIALAAAAFVVWPNPPAEPEPSS
jgi:Fusaric acid resistance protein-like